MPHVDPPRRRVRDVVGDAALLVLADGKRAVVRPRQARGVLVARRTNIYQRAVERREARVADVVRRVREDDRVDDDRRGDADSSPSATMKLLQVVRVAAFITHN